MAPERRGAIMVAVKKAAVGRRCPVTDEEFRQIVSQYARG